jgi:hypothetical protein
MLHPREALSCVSATVGSRAVLEPNPCGFVARQLRWLVLLMPSFNIWRFVAYILLSQLGLSTVPRQKSPSIFAATELLSVTDNGG